MFQHRHYVAVAASIAKLPVDVRDLVAARFVADFGRDNPKFDAARFVAAARGKQINGRDHQPSHAEMVRAVDQAVVELVAAGKIDPARAQRAN